MSVNSQQAEQAGPTMTSYLAPRVREIQPSGIRRFFDLASGSKDIITLGVGEPDFITPWHVREACVYSLERGYTSYTSNAGTPELREAIAEYLYSSYDVKYNPKDEILVTVGASEAIDLALRALIEPGDEILVPVPCYISYSPIVTIGGGIPVEIETYAGDNFKLKAEHLKAKITPKSKVLILNYPSNPTGGIMTYEDWLPIAKVVEEHDLIVISDEIYSELTYGQKHVSFASIPGMKDRTILVNGFSKAFAMTGWRMGYACGHPDLIYAMLKIHQYTVMCAPVMGQVAALEALRNGLEEKDQMIESYNQRRRLIVQGLRDIGLSCHEPQGAFYAFPSIESTGLTSDEFAQRLLIEAKVAAVPGNVFGAGGEGFLRCSYATGVSQINEALHRIGEFVHKLKLG
ncbi:MAG: aminotransferase class I/II-fold pyridoxal phosphate-dependent enzyme [Paenibacillus macerans]|nr:aminotransferase class I/II-fold pyridoxal phosphate-dependent enzyme [Paenibacillus macerans]MDU7477870.1 aminotransferase class I/II-fold pyridoxal phosphate-dependent enzyme [Paenibacillus macerans]MEC0138615.1 aminotransferase class I/II-fold pyridoxal phosphate-dependent enzyme [Paenibacillus macerans]MEC0151974.1 aminotransferase class I/II-fold pyridoxal phosphate-dependent enzyme [Paenibacillus macerans]MEC0329725.1 aminotransferase class I/II-fold pyridoxal phosphate-dependent enzym